MESNKFIKPMAFYFPQFHKMPENDKLWGNGFTEWNNLKSWTPKFQGHELMKPEWGFYDLENKEIRSKQYAYAREIGMYGFVHYHYWFPNKEEPRVMHKVTEAMLDDEDRLPFALMWANESWKNTWYGKDQDVFLKQEYGDKKDWEIHSDYLIKIFKNDKYIKVNNKPVFLIYRSNDSIKKIVAFLEVLNRKCLENNFGGVYAVESMDHRNTQSNSKIFSANSEFNPNFIKRYGINTNLKSQKNVTIMNSKLKMNLISKKNNASSKNYIKCVYNGWDCSPRSYARRAYVDSEITKADLILQYAESTLTSFEYHNNTGIILNFAWNEWGEGAIVEPDTVRGAMVGDAHKEVFNVNFKTLNEYKDYLRNLIRKYKG